MRSRLSVRTYLFFVLLVAFAVRLYRLGVASLWYDETVSLYLARQDLAALTRHTAGDIHPPLYYYLLHFWGRMAGWSEFSAAFVSVFFGVLLIALVYRVAKEWFAAPVPLLAALLVAVSPFNLWYSQEVRMYTLGALLGLASVYLFVRMLAGTDPHPFPPPSRTGEGEGGGASFARRDLLAYAGVSALGLYTLYYFVFVLVFENLVALVWLIGRNLPDRSRHSQNARSFDSAPHTARGSAAHDIVECMAIMRDPSTPSARAADSAQDDASSGDDASSVHRCRPAASATQDDSPFFARSTLGGVLRNLQSLVSNLQSLAAQSPIRIWLLSQLAIVVLYLPWAFIALHQALDPPVPPWRSLINPLSVLVESFSALTLGQSVDPVQVWPLLVLAAALVGIALLRSRSFSRAHQPGISGSLLLAYTFVPVLVILLLSLWKPLYHVRYIYIYSVGFDLLLAIGLAGLVRFRFGRALTVGSLVLFVVAAGYSDYSFWFNPRYADDDLRGAVQRISSLWRPGDAILIDAGYTYTAFDYYGTVPIAWQGRLSDYTPGNVAKTAGAVVLETGSIGGAPSLGWGSRESDFYATTAEETRAALDRVFAAHPRVWLLRLYDTVVDPDGLIRAFLAERGRLIDDQGFAGESFARVQGYLTSRVPLTTLPPTAISRRILLGRRIALVGFEPGEATLRAGMPLDVNVYWQAEEPTNIDEHVFVGLYAEDGTLIAAGDETPLGSAWGTARWAKGEILRDPIRLMVPLDVPSGRYVLRVAMYNPLTEETLAPEPGTGVAENNQIELTSVLVRPAQ